MSGQSGRAALQIVGTVVGAYFGGPVGATIGSTLGALAGNALFPLDAVQGPRLDDLSVSTAEYGQPIPLVFGARRIAAAPIWMSPVWERSFEETAGGKGGGGQEQVTYRYYAALALMLCAGPIVGIRRIWFDNKLIYDGSPDASGESAQAGARFLADYTTLYTGTETQLPDPTIESYEGVGQVPAHRGYAYLVIRELDLTFWGNRVPNIEIEVVTAGSVTQYREVLETASSPITYRIASTGAYPRITQSDGALRISNSGDAVTRVHTLDGAFVSQEARSGVDDDWWPMLDSVSYPSEPSQLVMPLFDGNTLYAARGPTKATTRLYVKVLGGVWPLLERMAWWTAGADLLITLIPCVDRRHFMLLTSAVGVLNTSPTHYYLYRYDGGPDVTLVDAGTCAASPPIPFGPLTSTGTDAGSVAAEERAANMLESNLTHGWVAGTASGVVLVLTRAAGVLSIAYTFSGALPVNNATPSLYCDDGLCYVVAGNTVWLFSRNAAVEPTTVPSATVVQALCAAAGYAGGEIDVSSLTAQARGYAVASRMSARQALEPLALAYAFDAVESDGVLRFVQRGGAVAATLTEADLGASGGDPVPVLSSRRGQEAELPRQVEVSYIAAGADYRVSTQRGQRTVGYSADPQQVQLALVLTDDEAQAIAERLTFSAWHQRTPRQFSTSLKWLRLDPTDRVVLQANGRSYTLLLTEATDDNGVRQLAAVDDDANLYALTGVGASTPGAVQGVTAPGPTRLLLADLPALRDADNDAGFYLAACGYSPSWPGAIVFRSVDNGATYQAAFNAFTDGTIGSALTALPDWTGDNSFDEGGTVDVQLTSGSLASVTREQVLGGANAALLGNEIIQFRSATLIAANTYRLSGLLRGRRGTEQHESTHVVGDVFVLLTTSISRFKVLNTEIGQARLYKPVTAGRTQAQTDAQTATVNGNSLRPLSPVQLAITLATATGDWLLRWVRRGRLDAEWRDNVDVPLGEASELYDVEILNAAGTAVVRTFSNLTTPSCSYTNAQQVTDFGSPPSTLRWRVYQRSATVGRGFPASAALPTPSALPVTTFTRNFNDGGVANLTAFSGSISNVSGALRVNSGGAQVRVRFDALASHQNGAAQIDFVVPSASGGFSGIGYRSTLSSNWTWLAYYDRSSNELKLARNTPSFTLVGSFGITLAAGTTHTLRVEYNGTSHVVYLNGVARITVTDSNANTSGQTGVVAGNAAGDYDFDNFLVEYT